jgi:hypothetical protein
MRPARFAAFKPIRIIVNDDDQKRVVAPSASRTRAGISIGRLRWEMIAAAERPRRRKVAIALLAQASDSQVLKREEVVGSLVFS